jgi:sugar/nucleoside kinase (ribokinase family)
VVLGGDATGGGGACGTGGTASRTMLSDRGAAGRLAPADLPPLRGVDHLHLSGYVLGDPGSRAAGRAALAAARAAGLSTSLDPQVTGVLGRDLLDGPVDLLLPAVDELAALTGSPVRGDAGRGRTEATAVPRAAAALLDLAGAVVVTQGAAGATWVDRRGVWSSAAPAVEEVDPTGAGDAFDAGLLAARLAGADPQEALVAGCAAGARAVSRRGARPARRGPRGRCP